MPYIQRESLFRPLYPIIFGHVGVIEDYSALARTISIQLKNFFRKNNIIFKEEKYKYTKWY